MRMNTIKKAAEEDRNAILKLYRTRLYGPADWNEYYPNEETIEFDLSRDALFVMKNDAGELIATISIDEDEEVDSLTVWEHCAGRRIGEIVCQRGYAESGNCQRNDAICF